MNRLLHSRSLLLYGHCRRYQSTKKQQVVAPSSPASSWCWQIDSYAGISALRFNRDVPLPTITSPREVLVKVACSSVNPIDVAMAEADQQQLVVELNRALGTCDFGDASDPLPLTLGRDFSGEVMSTGRDASDFRVGQEVWGATMPSQNGCHSSHVVVDRCCLAAKPKVLSHEEAAAVPYAALTAYSAIIYSGELNLKSAEKTKTRVLVLGASGGVGHLAVQMLKAWGCEVVATCSSDAREMILGLGADDVLNYKDPNFNQNLLASKRFDLILDCAQSTQNDLQLLRHLKPWNNSKYVTLSSPLLRNLTRAGYLAGAVTTAGELLRQNVKSLTANGSTFRWAYYAPAPGALDSLAEMATKGQLKPRIQKVLTFEELPQSYELVKAGSLRGKIVLRHH